GTTGRPGPCCGIHGLKPTGGRIPLLGHWLAPNWREPWLQPGPMARSVADLALALRVLAAPEEGATPAPAPLGDWSAVAVRGLRGAAYAGAGYYRPAPARP